MEYVVTINILTHTICGNWPFQLDFHKSFLYSSHYIANTTLRHSSFKCLVLPVGVVVGDGFFVETLRTGLSGPGRGGCPSATPE